MVAAKPWETTFIGARSGSVPSTSNSQRVSPDSSSAILVKPSFA